MGRARGRRGFDVKSPPRITRAIGLRISVPASCPATPRGSSARPAVNAVIMIGASCSSDLADRLEHPHSLAHQCAALGLGTVPGRIGVRTRADQAVGFS